MKKPHFHRKRNRGKTVTQPCKTAAHFALFRRIGRIGAGFAILAPCLGMLSACDIEVHWFGQSAMVPWYIVVIPSMAILLIAHLCFLRGRYVCPKCQTEIQPRWYELSVWLHDGNRRVVKCPHCGRRGFCARIR